MLDHVGFGVSDYERSKAFYSVALAPLDIELIMEPSKRAAGFGRAGKPFFWLEATRSPVTQVHVAFACDSRDVVDAFHEAGLAAGGSDNGAPGSRPIYHEHYYGAYVLDPDGNNIEAVCHRPALKRLPRRWMTQIPRSHLDPQSALVQPLSACAGGAPPPSRSTALD